MLCECQPQEGVGFVGTGGRKVGNNMGLVPPNKLPTAGPASVIRDLITAALRHWAINPCVIVTEGLRAGQTLQGHDTTLAIQPKYGAMLETWGKLALPFPYVYVFSLFKVATLSIQ